MEVDAPVSARLEVAEIHRRVIAAGGPALLFTRVEGADFPLVTNLFGTARRAELAFGPRPFRTIRRLVELAQTLLPPTPGKLWGARDIAAQALRVGLRRVRRGPVTERLTRDVRLDRLPALTCWPEDGGPFVTLPLVYTEHPDGHGSNLGMYRMQIHGPATTGMHWQIGKGGGFHYDVAEARGQALPVTVFLGGPPALVLGAIAPLPENLPELLLASLVLGERVRRAPGPAEHPLVAEAEFALIGRVAPGVRRSEGPFGDHYGYYSLAHDYPVLDVEWIAHRRDAIFPATVVGKPRQEDFFLGDLLQELLAPLFPLVMPGVLDLWSFGETGYHSLAAVAVRDRYAREAMASAFRVLGEGQLSLTKFLFVVDARRRPARLPRAARARARADAAGDGPVRLRQPVDGHARLHRSRGQPGLEGDLARPRGAGPRSPARVPAGDATATGRARSARLLPGLPRPGRPRVRGRSRRRRAARRGSGLRRLAAARPGRRRRPARWRAPPTSSGRPSPASNRPPTFTPPPRAWCATISCAKGRS